MWQNIRKRVGVEAATEMYEQGLCLEEYLDKIEK